MCDSSSAICLAQNPLFLMRAKHIKVRHHFLIDHIEKGDIEMKLGVCHPYGMVWGDLVFYLVYFVSFCFSVAFPSYSPKLTLLHSLY
jgi:hypothetical protein